MPNVDWLQAFPKAFDFYHLGSVQEREGSPFASFELESAILKDSHAVGFWLYTSSGSSTSTSIGLGIGLGLGFGFGTDTDTDTDTDSGTGTGTATATATATDPATALLILLFDRGLDQSTYTEMGNVLASRLATELSRRTGSDVLISPPRALDTTKVAQSARAAAPRVLQKTYVHLQQNRHVPVEVLILPLDAAKQTGAGHA